ncbi:MAG: hypothetical protein H7Z19_24165, partial [Chitinophagaceae bacterium]|nr:hypothetical protein [Rubrivivax sp.]
HAAATRHAGLHQWIVCNPGCDLRLWVSGELLRDVGCDAGSTPQPEENLQLAARDELTRRYGADATGWALTLWKSEVAQGACALAGIDLAGLTLHARAHQVRIRSVVPWWYHAFLQAKQCVNGLNAAERASVCVVEGRQVVWVSMVRGSLAGIRQSRLAEPSVLALGEAMASMRSLSAVRALPVVLGQGLVDGARTGRLEALVLGRLDGEQPPNWLQPGSQVDAH